MKIGIFTQTTKKYKTEWKMNINIVFIGQQRAKGSLQRQQFKNSLEIGKIHSYQNVHFRVKCSKNVIKIFSSYLNQ